MAVKHIGIPDGLVEQPGYQFNRSRTGGVTIKSKFVCKAHQLEQHMPPIDAEHPRFSYALLDEIVGIREEGELATLELIFKGPSPVPPNQPEPASYKLVAATREEPLRTHKDYKDFTNVEAANVEKWVEDPDTYTGPNFGSGSALSKYATLRKNGVESYLVAGMVWREETTSSAGWGSISSVGKINAPAGGAPGNGTGNWLLTSMESERQGGTHKRSREWTASGPEGWNPNLYS